MSVDRTYRHGRARAARRVAAARELGIVDVPLMCAQELHLTGALPRALRVLAHVDSKLARADLRHVLLGARRCCARIFKRSTAPVGGGGEHVIRTMAVVGTGLIGTSVALAASRHEVTVYLVDRDESTARAAAALGAGVFGPPPKSVDLAVLAVPPSRVGPVLAEKEARGLARYYTDVASVKSEPERDVLRGIADPTRYVGGHPIAGRERSGPLASRADLFERRSWVLTPSRFTAPETVERALELVSLCGAVPVVMNSAAHDDAVALTSHVPHLLASLMAARLQHAPAETTQLVGQGLRDVTRIAAGDPELWVDIIQANAEPVAKVLTEMNEDFAALRTALQDGDRSQLRKNLLALLDRGVAGVARIRVRA